MDQWIFLTQIIITVLLFPAGWMSAHYLNVSQTKRSKRMEYRLIMLHSFLDIWFFIQKNSAPFTDPAFLPMLRNARSNFLLYGFKDEQTMFEGFVDAIEKQDIDKANEILHQLVEAIPKKLRKELGL